MTKLAIVIPAAGASRRMGERDKLLEPVDGAPLVSGVANRALRISDDVFVTLPDLSCPRAKVLEGVNVQMIAVPDAADGMSASLRRVCARVAPDTGLMVIPADMPDITVDDLRKLASAFEACDGKHILQATSATGAPGHPVVPADLVPDLATLTGDSGAKPVITSNAHRVRRIALPFNHAITDLDTPDAWARWRASNPTR